MTIGLFSISLNNIFRFMMQLKKGHYRVVSEFMLVKDHMFMPHKNISITHS